MDDGGKGNEMDGRQHDVGAVREAPTYGECDRCACDSQLYKLDCEAGCFNADEGSYRYCSTCVRREMSRHDPIGAAR